MAQLCVLLLLSILLSADLSAQGFAIVTQSSGTAVTHDGNQIIDMQIGSGAAWIDYDNDGDLDLYVTLRTGPNKLFKNQGNGTFTNVAVALGVSDPDGDGGGVAVADFNNDGWKDIYLANCQGDRLFKNNGGLSFTDITATAFEDPDVGGPSRTPSASWGDYNNDGFLDLYLAQHTPSPNWDPPLGSTTQDFLYLNNGDETFEEVSALLGLEHLTSWGFIVTWTDFDHDDDMDIFLVNDCRPIVSPLFLPTKIFRNDGGTDPLTWSFTEVSDSVGVDDCRSGMGVAVGDYNRDGWQDIFYTNIGPCVLFENDHGTFIDASDSAEVALPVDPLYSWGCAFFDYNHDGWQDLSVMLGALGGSAQNSESPNFFFKNNGDGTFSDIAPQLGIDFPNKSRNGIYGDYDNDGDLDLYIVNYGDSCTLLRNELNNGFHWIKIGLRGIISNRDGIGSKIQIKTPNGVSQFFETRSGSNLGGGDSPLAHFGIGSQTMISELKVKWPSGRLQILNNVSVDQTLQIVEDTVTQVTKTWEGTIDTLWTNPDNWSFGTLPKITDYVLIPAGRPHYPKLGTGLLSIGSITGNPNFFCGTLHIAPGAQFTTGVNTQLSNHNEIIVAGLLTIRNQTPPGLINHPGADLRIETTGDLIVND